MPRRILPAEAYWNEPASVHAMDRTDAVPAYEQLLVAEAVRRAGGAAAVRTVHVLGVGAGRELPAVRSAAPGARIMAWDVAEAMVRACRDRVARLGLADVEVAVRDVADLRPEADGTAQVVVAVNAMLGYPVPGSARTATAAAVHRLLAPGGVLALVVQQRRGRPDWAAWFAVHDALAAGGALGGRDPGDRLTGAGGVVVPHHHYTRRELRRLLEGAGFGSVDLWSLRRFAGDRRLRIPLRSPNPLVGLATA